MSAYAELEAVFRRISALKEAAGMLHWDMSVMMPEGGIGARTEQLAALRLVNHELLTAPATLSLLDDAEAEKPELDDWQAANLAEMHRARSHACAVNGALVEALTRASSNCELIWREARLANDFKAVAPALAELLGLVREAADAKAGALDCSPYEALFDEYEPGGRVENIDAIFNDLAAFLPGFLEKVLDWQQAEPAPLMPDGPFPVAAQQALARTLMERLGFDFSHGRLDISLHPFCGGVPDDVRITTRYYEDDFTQSLMGVLHETGHALYEMGLPSAWRRQPVGEARSMVLHESQSLLFEMQTCRSPEFIGFVATLIRDAFGGDGPAWQPYNLTRLYTKVERGLIRVDADEVTYPAHVILRYRIERELIAGRLVVADLPEAWNAGMEELLHITPPDDASGCMQDIHWYDGAFGYFPTYTLGAMAAAQLFEAARAADRDILPGIATGDFAPLLAWLHANVHAKGGLLGTDELIKAATGKKLGDGAFKRHLEARYLP